MGTNDELGQSLLSIYDSLTEEQKAAAAGQSTQRILWDDLRKLRNPSKRNC